MSEVTTIEVERVIHEFLVDFQAALERMKPKDFAAFQDSLRKNLLREPVNQEQKAARLAFSILSETDFDLRKCFGHPTEVTAALTATSNRQKKCRRDP